MKFDQITIYHIMTFIFGSGMFGSIIYAVYHVGRASGQLEGHDKKLTEHDSQLEAIKVKIPTLMTYGSHNVMCAAGNEKVMNRFDKLETSVQVRMDKMDDLREKSKEDRSKQMEDIMEFIGRVSAELKISKGKG